MAGAPAQRPSDLRSEADKMLQDLGIPTAGEATPGFRNLLFLLSNSFMYSFKYVLKILVESG